MDPVSNKQVLDHIKRKWIDELLDRFNIVIEKQSESTLRSPIHNTYIE